MKLGLGFKAGKPGGREGGQERETRRPRAATMASTASGVSRLPLACKFSSHLVRLSLLVATTVAFFPPSAQLLGLVAVF
jgi:hypothetical protein